MEQQKINAAAALRRNSFRSLSAEFCVVGCNLFILLHWQVCRGDISTKPQ